MRKFPFDYLVSWRLFKRGIIQFSDDGLRLQPADVAQLIRLVDRARTHEYLALADYLDRVWVRPFLHEV